MESKMLSVEIIEKLVNTKVVRYALKFLTRYCPIDRQNRFENALLLYSGMQKKTCLKCYIAKIMVSPGLNIGASFFGMKKEKLKNLLKKQDFRRKFLLAYVKGIADFGLVKPFVPSAPLHLVWEVTHNCNLNCIHCSANAKKNNRKNELSTEEAIKVIDILEKFNVPCIEFSGGEPLTRPDIFRLIKYTNDKGIYVAIATNGTLITKDIARKMKENGVKYIRISLDSIYHEKHDDFRNMKGAFNKTLQGIKNVVETGGFYVIISTTVTKKNYKEIPEIIDLCEKLGVDSFTASNFIPVGRGKEIVDIDLTPDEREEVLKFLYKKMQETSITIYSTAPQISRVALQSSSSSEILPSSFVVLRTKEKKFLLEYIGGCNCGRLFIRIMPNGDIVPCSYITEKVGNILEDDIEDIWKNNQLFKNLRNRKLLKPECSNCEYVYHCGGCRARAYGYFQDFFAPDPGCINNKKYFDMLKK
ncbi:MAG: radical SAM/SPASM domain-containing protein [Thermoplasmata archaeon]|nr:MAG: radical SAM/SPASM domain-containing protein [Thermoplasmata archaeon]